MLADNVGDETHRREFSNEAIKAQANTKLVPIENGSVCCPNCKATFNVQQHKSIGASYAKSRNHLTSNELKILKTITLTQYHKTFFSKNQLMLEFPYVKPGPFSARFSEMIGIGVFKKSYEEKNIPFYYVDWNRVQELKD